MIIGPSQAGLTQKCAGPGVWMGLAVLALCACADSITAAKTSDLDAAAEAAPALAHTRVFADGLSQPRCLYVLPNGDVLVAETTGTPPDEESRIMLLRDTDGDGAANLYSVLIEHLEAPTAIALVKEHLYLSSADSVLRFPYATGDLYINARGEPWPTMPHGDLRPGAPAVSAMLNERSTPLLASSAGHVVWLLNADDTHAMTAPKARDEWRSHPVD